jgi:ABC-type nickel/cobalt efflux system permease component RcnA
MPRYLQGWQRFAVTRACDECEKGISFPAAKTGIGGCLALGPVVGQLLLMPDLAQIVQSASAHAWLYLPLATILGALHALEPGHAKSLIAAYIVAIRGSAGQAVTLATSAAVGHTIVVWAIAIAALAVGDRYVVDQAEPWLTFLSGVLIVLLAIRMFWALRQRGRHHGRDHHHPHGHVHDHGHGHHHHPPLITAQSVTTGQIVWFGFTGGLLPCPAAIAVLLVCIQLKAFALGVAMVAAFSVGLALTLILIGVSVAWGTRKVAGSWSGFDRWAGRLPYLSAGIVMVMGLALSAAGLSGLTSPRKPT